jgi:alpha-glucosidase
MRFFQSVEGVQKISFGEMIPTDTIHKELFNETESFYVPGAIEKNKNHHIWKLDLRDGDVVYGLGQSIRGMNKRGFVYESFCSDDPNHTPDKKSLYGAHNFFVVQSENPWGIYIDFAGKVSFDVGFEHQDILKIDVEGVDFDAYIFNGTYKEIIKKFRSLIGQSYVPPKWGFGYQQSRWSYVDKNEVVSIAEKFDDYDLPCDAIYLDIDYMERFKDFTVSDERFSDFKTFVSDLKVKGIQLIPIIDAGVKIESGYDVYEEGVKNSYFCNDENGNPFVAAVWPGKVHFPDFLNSQTRKWFGQKYHRLMDLGIEGFWNDMNEPAIFYSEQGLKDAIEFVADQEGKNLDIYTFFELKDKIMNISNAESDYKSMYHNYDGVKVNHYDVHNLYGYFMTRAATEGFISYSPEKRHLMITRASHIGMAKYSGIWTGDNHSWWEHLKLNIQMMPGLGMAGFLYSGADTGGFGGEASGELLTRWLQFSIFTPLLRNHSAMGTRKQEPWMFEANTLDRIRDVVKLRYALVPYLYSEFMKANFNHDLLFAPLSYEYGHPRAKLVEDQLLLGDSVMLAPVYEQNSRGRSVYLPEKMVLWKATAFEHLGEKQFELLEEGYHYVDVALNEIPLYLKPGKLLVMTKPENRISTLDESNLVVLGFVPDRANYELYNDDGLTKGYESGDSLKTIFKVNRIGNEYHVSVDTNDMALKSITFYLIDDNGKWHVIKQNDFINDGRYV